MMSTPSNTLINPDNAVPPPSALQSAPEDETLRAQQNVEARERRLNSPFYKFFARKKNARNKAKNIESYATGGEDQSSSEHGDSMLVNVLGHPDPVSGDDYSAIVLKDMNLPKSNNRPSYRWAIVYENQRGITLFSIPLYSRCPLFPTDPPNYTLPSTSKPASRDNQPFVTLTDYPLPDNTWRWVSNEWMIDMRGAASVQQDGFEYNWRFSQRGWRYRSGFMGAGSWVRRRRWIRLMVRHEVTTPEQKLRDASAPQVDLQTILYEVWQGDQNDWCRLRKAMRLLDIDGMKLDVWRVWLDCSPVPEKRLPSTDMGSTRQSFKIDLSEGPPLELTSIQPARKDHIATVLHERGKDVLALFVYSECRTEFLRMLIEAGLIKELSSGISPQYVDFWRQLHSLKEYYAQIKSGSDD